MWACHKRQQRFFSILSCHDAVVVVVVHSAVISLCVYLRKRFLIAINIELKICGRLPNQLYTFYSKNCTKMCKIRAEEETKPLDYSTFGTNRHKQTNVKQQKANHT